jgi:phage host-nuclease inhibitor protein Gam
MATKQKPEIKPRQYGSWLQINLALAELRDTRADYDALKATLNGEVAAAHTAHGEALEQKAAAVQEIEQGIDAFLHEHREQLMGEAGNRTLQLENGVVGLRWGPAKLATMSRVTFDKVLERARALPARLRSLFVREEATLDKKALLKALREGVIPDEVRRELGVDAVQEEYAVIEPA